MQQDKLVKLKAAGKLAYQILEELESRIHPGVNLLEIEEFARRQIQSSGFKPAFLGFKGYPAVTCISINSEIVHGIPRDYGLQSGDVVTVDLGVSNDGWIVDTARTYAVGNVTEEQARLLETTKEALRAALGVCKSGNRVGDISHAIQSVVESANFSIIKELTGHGVGKTLQEPPTIPNFGRPGVGPILKTGMVIAVEPITATRPTRIILLSDGWTIAAENEDITTAQYEHTVIVGESGPIVLTDGS